MTSHPEPAAALHDPAGVDPVVPAELLEGLNDAQAAAVSCLLGPLLVVAGPGSGKTRVLTHRIAALVRTRLAWPSQVLAVTFTNKAAGEMRERLVGLLGEDDVQRMWVATFHSMCARILRIEHETAGLPRAFSILDSGDVRTVLKGVLIELDLPHEPAEMRLYASAISKIKNGGRTRQDATLALVYERYRAALARLGALDFDDLLLRTLELLQSNPDVLERWRSRFRFVLVDEYQDTNPVQYQLVSLLASGHRNVCVVGDADQAIYGFRSATPAALTAFTDDWTEARVVVLEENYRSTAAILEVCQSVIDPSPARFRPRLFTSNPTGDPVRLVVCDDDRDEAAFVAASLAERALDATAAVLVRTNAQTRLFEEALLHARVPYSVVGALRFYERAEVKDALAYLRLIANPRDAVALARVVTAPKRGLGPKAVEELTSFANSDDSGVDGNLIDAMTACVGSVSKRQSGLWGQLAEILQEVHAAAAHDGPAGALGKVLSLGLRDHVASLGADTAADRLENLSELVNAARSFVERPDAVDPEGRMPADLEPFEQTLAFLSNVALVSAAEEDAPAGTRPPVALMTAHASKGKEFDVVFVAGVEEGMFPHVRAGEDANEDEERRLLFVACSRARRQLSLTRASRRMVFGKLSQPSPSRFIADLPQSVRVVVRPSSRPSSGWDSRHHATEARKWQDGRPGMVSPPRSAPVKAPVAAGPRLPVDSAVVGALVSHRVFGLGTISDVFGAGDDVTVTVDFKDGPRMLKIAMAPLELSV